MRENIPNGQKIHQMAIKYPNIFHCTTLHNFTQIRIFGLKMDAPSGNPAQDADEKAASKKDWPPFEPSRFSGNFSGYLLQPIACTKGTCTSLRK
jgi:hypothetical protein